MDFVRICSRLDPRCYKAFLAVIAEGSFSAAAPRAAMTVSGVSQHIASIEEAIGAPLFLRTAAGCRLTEPGERFNRFVKSYSNLVADLFEDLSKAQNELKGLVRYAMPPSCILSPHFPLLLQRRLAHPDLALNVEMIPNADIICQLLDGHIDFGFVTEKVRNAALVYREFCEEEYVLVGSDDGRVGRIDEENVIHQRYIFYPGFDTYFYCWVRHFFPALSHVDARSLYHVSGRINTIDGAIKMTVGGLGISVFPRHCVQHLIEERKLHELAAHVPPLYNPIYVVHDNRIGMPRRAEVVIGWFFEMLQH